MDNTVRFQDPGEGIREAEMVEVLVSAGDEVSEGQDLFVVETDKANFEVRSPQSGTVEKIQVAIGDTVEVGQALLTLGADGGSSRQDSRDQANRNGSGKPAGGQPEDDDEGTGEAEQEAAREETREDEKDQAQGPEDAEDTEDAEDAEDGNRADQEASPEREEDVEETADEEPEEDRRRAAHERHPEDDEDPGRRASGRPVPASPATRRLARRLEIDLRKVAGSGEQGRVLAQDVRAFAQGSSEPTKGNGRMRMAESLPDFSRWGPIERVPLRSVRRTIARRMAGAWDAIPHVTHIDYADVTDLDALRRRQAERLEPEGRKLTLTVLVMKAVAAVLREYPRFNATLDAQEEDLIYKRYYHLGVAIDTERGLLVPAIRDVDRKGVRELAGELDDLSERARDGKLRREEMAMGTFTITNVGGIGGAQLTPIINAPQVAILGLGRARLEPCVRGTAEAPEIVARRMLPLCLSFDHRVNDGADAARFTNRLIAILGDPESFAVSV